MFEYCCMVMAGYPMKTFTFYHEAFLLPLNPISELLLPLAKMQKWLERGERGDFLFSNFPKKKKNSPIFHEEGCVPSP
jgi:hypothetical protein